MSTPTLTAPHVEAAATGRPVMRLHTYPLARPRVRRNGYGDRLWTVELPGEPRRSYHRSWREACTTVRRWHLGRRS